MTDLIGWIAIIIGFASLIVGIFTLGYQLQQSLKSQKYLSDIAKNQSKQIKILKKQVERMSKNMPENTQLQREKLELKKREQEAKENWKKFDAIIKTIRLFKK